MVYRIIFIASTVAFFLLFIVSCEEGPVETTKEAQTSTISGYVRDSLNQPIFGAIVVDNGQHGLTDTTDVSGAYKFEYKLQSEYKTKITVYAIGYYRDTAEVTLPVGGTVTKNFQLRRDWSQQAIIGSGKSAANIKLISVSDRDIAIRGTGLKDYSVLQFQITDSSGNPLVGANKAIVRFSLLSGPQGGEYISPDSVETDINGMVTTTVWSGSKAGIVQVNATTLRGLVKAMPVTITITGGYPDGEHFSVTPGQYNVAGQIWDNLVVPITVIVGDRYGNPPVPSVVKFTTTGGIITGSAITNEHGIATATLITTNPRPSNGRVYVTASTVGDSNYRRSDSLISRTILIVFSGKTRIIAPTNTIVVPDSGSISFSYKVSDENGFPLVAGSTISVRITDLLGNQMSSVQLRGDVNVTTKDTYDTSSTNFKVTLIKTSRSAIGGPAKVVIDVKTPMNGNGDAISEVSAYVVSTSISGGTSGFSKVPAKIEVLSVERSTLELAESGTNTASTTRLTFVVKDSLGNRIVNFANSGIPRTYVAFSLIPSTGLGGGEYFTPSIDSLNDNGEVTTTFHAGTRSGIVRIAASIVGSSSQPAYVDLTIFGGYPDENRVIANLDRQNYPGLVTTGPVGTISVQLSDQYNNPVRLNTPIYFTTTGGQVQPLAVTDGTGKATATLYGGGQAPNDGGRVGYGQVILRTYGRGSTLIQQTIPFLFSGKPIISVTGLRRDSINLYTGDIFVLNFKVFDENRNPLAAGNTIKVSISGPASSAISMAGDYSITTVDTKDTNYTNFQVTLKGGEILQTSAFDVYISVEGPNGSTTKRLFGTLYPVTTIIPPTESARQPAQIAFLGISRTSIYVAGTGGIENSVITYEIRDSLGTPVKPPIDVTVKFELSFLPSSYNTTGTNPELLPDSARNDNNGQVKVLVYSGTRAGVVQVRARIELPNGKVIISEPVKVQVHAGFPDQKHFTLTAAKRNFPGLDKAFQENTITVQVGDKFSNPVAVGTTVRFETWHGTISTGGLTNEQGFVSQILWSSNPFPMGSNVLPALGPGYSYVKAMTEGQGGATIQDSIILLWTGEPIIVKTRGPQSFTLLDGTMSDSLWEFTVTDRFGHPMSSGTRISIEAPGARVHSNADVTLGDTFQTGDGITKFYVMLEDANPNDPDPNPKPCPLKVVVNHPVYGIYSLTLAIGVIH